MTGAPPSLLNRLARSALRLYPRAWQDRYAAEVAQVLDQHRATLWTVLDLVLGAIDAHRHPNVLPTALMSNMRRLRTSEVVVFCACVLFAFAWLPVQAVRDPLPAWEAAANRSPELRYALDAVQLSGVLLAFGVLLGSVPLLLSSFQEARAARRWPVLGLLFVPVAALLVLAAYAIIAMPFWTQRRSPLVPEAPFTTLALAFQFGLVALVLLAVVGSCVALAAAVALTTPNARAARAAFVPAIICTGAITFGLAATVTLGALASARAPQILSLSSSLISAVPMAAALAIAAVALRRGATALN